MFPDGSADGYVVLAIKRIAVSAVVYALAPAHRMLGVAS